MNQVTVNFKEITGKVKPVHGVCCAPYDIGKGSEQSDIQKYFTEGHIPYCRLHDCNGSYGGTYFVDVPNIFTNFDADEEDPDSYDFHYTDEYIGAIQQTGTQAYYRLGVTIEWGSKKYTSLPPRDFVKFAKICEHIIRHYNEGWANGFTYGLTYWEIWNEPENPGNKWGKCQWGGTKEEFFELYRIVSKYLKMRFPKLKIGGYGSCGFYATTRKPTKDTREFVTFFTDFLAMAKNESCPLDFFSWHIYSADEREVMQHAAYARKTLDTYGFTETESHLNEWNIHAEGTAFASKHSQEGMAFNAALLCLMQESKDVDLANYYCFSSEGMYNGLMDLNTGAIEPTWYPFVAFGQLYQMKNAVKVSVQGQRIYASAAKGQSECGVMIVNYASEENEVQVHLKGCQTGGVMRVLYIREGCNLEEEFSISSIEKCDLKIKCKKQEVVFLKVEKC